MSRTAFEVQRTLATRRAPVVADIARSLPWTRSRQDIVQLVQAMRRPRGTDPLMFGTVSSSSASSPRTPPLPSLCWPPPEFYGASRPASLATHE
jgi:hypothetical protein